MRIQLPNGLLDGVDLFNFAVIDELRGKQQNYLMDVKLVANNIGHLPKILGDMLLSLQTESGMEWKGKISEAIYKLPSGDLECILVKIRENTYGPKLFLEAVCPHCEGHNKNVVLMLDTLELDVLSHAEMLDHKEIELPKSKKKITLKPHYLEDLFRAVQIGTSGQEKLVTETIKLSIKTIDGSDKFTSDDIENLPSSDLYFLSEEAGKVKLEGTIDTDVEIECKHCKESFNTKLNSLRPDFFSPTGDIMSLSTPLTERT